MDPILERCCRIHVQKKTMTVCPMIGEPNEKAKKTVKAFTIMARVLLAW